MLGEETNNYPLVCESLQVIVNDSREDIVKNDDDILLIVVGKTGSGKSTLVHHIHDIYTRGSPSVSSVAFDKELVPKVLNEVLNRINISDRFFHYDEANVSSRDSMTTFNKKLIDIYETVREKHGFHIWCNPSANYLDKKFIEERVSGLIYCFKNPRGRFMLIPRKRLLDLLERYGNLKQETIERYGHKYAIIINGWFKDYPDNEFRQAYRQVKQDRINNKLKSFEEENDNGEFYNMKKASKLIGISYSHMVKVIEEIKEKKVFDVEKYKSVGGHYRFSIEAINEFIKYYEVRKDELKSNKHKPEFKSGQPVINL